MDSTKAYQFVRHFGLDTVMTDEDDVFLWARVLKRNWLNSMVLSNQRLSFYFDVANADNESRNGLRSIENWELKRLSDGRFEAELWSGKARVDISPRGLETKSPYRHIAIERPSEGKDVVNIYTAFHAAPLLGHGSTHIWRRHKSWLAKLLWVGGWRETWHMVGGWRS